MNIKIERTINEILDCDKRKEELEKIVVNQYYDFLKEEKGIKKGDTVIVREDRGIFVSLEWNSTRVRPVVMKMRKDGSPHASASIYCFDLEDMKLAPENK